MKYLLPVRENRGKTETGNEKRKRVPLERKRLVRQYWVGRGPEMEKNSKRPRVVRLLKPGTGGRGGGGGHGKGGVVLPLSYKTRG